MSKDLSFIANMTPEQAAKYYRNRQGYFRRMLSKFTSLLRIFFGKSFRGHVATASAVNVIEVRGGETGDVSTTNYGLTVQKFKVPGKRVLQKSLDALEMRDAIDELDAIIDKCQQSENAGMKALVKDMIKNRNALASTYEEALHAMTELADNNIPDEVNDLFKRVQKYFDNIEKQHVAQNENETEDELAYYINIGTKEGAVDFVMNCDITHWRDVTAGFHKALVVVVTARLEPTDAGYAIKSFVNILDRVALPYLYNLGTEIKGDNIATIGKNFAKNIDREIARHNVVMFATKAELNVDATEVQTKLSAIEGVSGVVVDPTEIVLEFPDNDRQIQTQVLKVLSNLREIKALVKKGYVQSLHNIDPNVHSYSLTLK